MSNYSDIEQEEILSDKTIENIGPNFELNGPCKRYTKSRYGLKESNCSSLEKKILKYVKENPACSNRNVAQQFGINSTLVNKIRSRLKESSQSWNRKSSGTASMFLECEKIPLVFTTRLDDMTVLAGSENDLVDNDNLLNDIEAASKPTFNIQTVSRKRKDPVYKEYYLLNNKLETYFLLRASHKECKRKKTLQLRSTPKVVLTKLENTQYRYILTKMKQPDNVIKVKEEKAIVSFSEGLNEPLPQKKSTQLQTVTLNLDYPDNNKGLIKFKYKDYFTNAFNIDPYIIICTINELQSIAFSFNNTWKPISLLRCRNTKAKKAITTFRSIFTREPRQTIFKCCWFKYNYTIRKIYYVNLLTFDDLKSQRHLFSSYHHFITSYHKCLRKSCRCCCRYKYNTNSELMHDDSKNISDRDNSVEEHYNLTILDNGYVDNLLKKRKRFNIIKKALTFQKPQTVTTLKKKKTTLKSGLVDTSLYLINDRRNFSEIYTFNSTGNVVDYYWTEGCLDKLHDNSLLLSSHWKQAKAVTPTNSCCWYSRNKTISELRRRKCLPEVINFLNRLHICSLGDCRCCCGSTYRSKSTKGKRVEFGREVQHLNIHRPFINNSEVKLSLDIGKVKIPYPKSQKNKVLKTYEKKPKVKESLTVKTPVSTILKEALTTKTPVSTKVKETLTETLVPNVTPQPGLIKAICPNDNLIQSKSNIKKNITPNLNTWSAPHVPFKNNPNPKNVHPGTGFVNIAPKPGGIINNGVMPQESTMAVASDRVIPEFSGNITNYVIRAINEIPEAVPSALEICKTFQGLVLSLDSDGKVSASLRKPVTLFSTLELKVLSNILCKAQKLVVWKSTKGPEESDPILISLNNPKKLTKEEEKVKQKILLFHNLSQIAKSKTDIFKHCLHNCMQQNENTVNRHVLEGTDSNMPIINEYFSLNQHQEFVSSQSGDPTPGPSGIQTKAEKSDMFNENDVVLPTHSNICLPIVGSIIQTVPNFSPIAINSSFIPNPNCLPNYGLPENSNDTNLFIPTQNQTVFEHNNQLFHPVQVDHSLLEESPILKTDPFVEDVIISSMDEDTWSGSGEGPQYVGLENENDPDCIFDNEELDIKQEIDIDIEEECILGA